MFMNQQLLSRILDLKQPRFWSRNTTHPIVLPSILAMSQKPGILGTLKSLVDACLFPQIWVTSWVLTHSRLKNSYFSGAGESFVASKVRPRWWLTAPLVQAQVVSQSRLNISFGPCQDAQKSDLRLASYVSQVVRLCRHGWGSVSVRPPSIGKAAWCRERGAIETRFGFKDGGRCQRRTRSSCPAASSSR